jgi:hypothetical protein
MTTTDRVTFLFEATRAGLLIVARHFRHARAVKKGGEQMGVAEIVFGGLTALVGGIAARPVWEATVKLVVLVPCR